jgi:hypothetical protein
VPHDLHALSWAIGFHRAVAKLATDNWRTPRYVTGRYPVLQLGSGHRRHPIAINEIPLPDGQAIIDVELTKFGEVKPDVSLEVRVETIKLTFDLLVELDLTERLSYNHRSRLSSVLKRKQVSLSAGLCLRHAWHLLVSDRLPRALQCDDDLSSGVSFSLVTESFRKITQGVAPVDDRRQLAGFDELLQNSQVLSVMPYDEHPHPLAHERR